MVSMIYLLALLPLNWSRSLGRLGSRVALARSPQTLKTIRTNIDLCFPDFSPSQREELALRRHYTLGALGAECGSSWIWPADKVLRQIRRVKGTDILEAAFAEGRGVIAITPHLGNWEIVGLYLANLYPTTSLYEPPDYPALDRLIYRARIRSGANLVPTNRRGVAQLRQALTKGHVTAILPDQVPRDPASGVRVPFYGKSAVTMTLVSRLLQKTECLAVFITALQSPDGYEIHIQQADRELYSADTGKSAASMNRGIESLIKLSPEQYTWEYKRFRPIPRDGTSPYRD